MIAIPKSHVLEAVDRGGGRQNLRENVSDNFC